MMTLDVACAQLPFRARQRDGRYVLNYLPKAMYLTIRSLRSFAF